MASPERPRAKRVVAAHPPFELLTDDLLAEILLRLPTLADLGRAAASCAAFSRVAASRAFLRRIRSVHPSPLLGLLGASSVHPAEPPHSSAPYARAFFGAADLSFSFLPCPGPDCWLPVDARDRDGRVLLVRYVKRPLLLGGIILIPLFAVCDPLSRRYSLLPEIPGDPVSRCGIKPFLVPTRDQQEETSFRVVSTAIDAAGKLFAFVFSSATGKWSRSAVGAGVQRSFQLASPRGYAYGCFYWKVDGIADLIMFDTHSMAFSVLSGQACHDPVIVEAGEGRLGMFTLDNSIISAASHLVYAIQHKNGSSCWRIERRVRLPSHYLFSFDDASDRYLLLRGTPWNQRLGFTMNEVNTGYFSVEFESMRIEKMCVLRSIRLSGSGPKLYAGFPPSLCLPSI